jgi:hypothetical protein
MTVITTGVPPSSTATAGVAIKAPAVAPGSGGGAPVPSTGQIWPR